MKKIIKIHHYTDETSLIIGGFLISLGGIPLTLDLYANVSVLKINFSKTKNNVDRV